MILSIYLFIFFSIVFFLRMKMIIDLIRRLLYCNLVIMTMENKLKTFMSMGRASWVQIGVVKEIVVLLNPKPHPHHLRQELCY